MNDNITLTVNDIGKILRQKIVNPVQTPLSQQIISKIKEQLNVNVFALYLSAFSQPIVDDKYPKLLFGKPKRYHYQKNLQIMVYVRGDVQQDDNLLKKEISEIVRNELTLSSIKISYPKYYNNLAEMEFFKAMDQKRSPLEVNNEEEETSVFLYSFEIEVLNYLLADIAPKFEKYIKSAFGVNACILCDFDKDLKKPYHRICFVSKTDRSILDKYDKKEILEKFAAFVREYDVWNVVTDYTPVFCLWDDLSRDQKLAYQMN